MNKTNVLDNLDTVKLYSTAKEVYELFQNEFSKEKLSEYLKLDDEIFLRKIFPDSDMKKNNNEQNKENMCFALEWTGLWVEKTSENKLPAFKLNDKDWCGGGIKRIGQKVINSYYIAYDNKKWLCDEENDLSLSGVAVKGREFVKNLITLCELAESDGDIDVEIKKFSNSKLYNHVFVHKFLHMNYPDKFFNWHSYTKLKAIIDAKFLEINSKEKFKMSQELCKLKIEQNEKIKFSEDFINVVQKIVEEGNAKNIILYGPPGTGKTYNTKTLVDIIKDKYNSDDSEDKVSEKKAFTTFHQSYSYEDFIIGIRPIIKDDKIAYEVKDGIFKKFCDNARNDIKTPYIFIIDEINRGNISKIFGELITIIEESKRGQSVILPYEKNGEQVEFSVPKNVYIIGTMNTADRSISMLDTALRRRFTFIEMMPNPDILDNIEAEREIELSKFLEAMNRRIEFLYDREHTIGHAYFMNEENKTIKDLDELRFVFRYKIIPLLQEYFFDDYEKIKLVLNDVSNEEFNGKFITKIKPPESLDENEYPSRYKISDEDWKIEDFKRIYE